MYPEISWLSYLNSILYPHEKLESSEEIVINLPHIFKHLVELYKKTPKRVLANYICWRVAMESADQLSERIRDIRHKFNAVLTGRNEKTARWKECIDFAQMHLHLATGALYVRKWFNKEVKTNMENMVHNIKHSFEQILTEVRIVLHNYVYFLQRSCVLFGHESLFF